MDEGAEGPETAELFEAIRRGDVERVDELITRDPDLFHARDEEGRTGLLVAVYHGEHEIVNLLHGRVPEIDIWEAAASGLVERVHEVLRDEPGQANFTSPDGFSPLGLASFFGHADVIEVLVEAGADLNERSRNAMQVCPLHSAAAHATPDVARRMCRILLEAGADPLLRQAGGWTPLHQAAAQGNLPLVDLLLDHGADPALLSEDGRAPVDLALANGHSAVVARLEPFAPASGSPPDASPSSPSGT